MTDEQQLLTVVDDHKFLLSERRRWARLAGLLDAPQAREVLGLIDAKLTDLEAERTGDAGARR